MTNLVIILGAGASFDYIDSNHATKDEKIRPPLTNDLLSPKRFGRYIEEFPEVLHLTSSVLTAIKAGKNFEEFLLELKEKGDHRLSQLAGLQFYLQRLFQVISDGFGNQPGNNYSELINKINDSKKNACIITFNYDLLLEQNIPFLSENRKISSYVSERIKVIKLHGSCDWAYSLHIDWPDDIEQEGGVYKYITHYPNIIFNRNRQLTLSIFKGYSAVIHDRTFYYYPAIAIPLPSKDTFICPNDHVQIMRGSIEQADKILIIGWKAGDQSLIKILNEICKKEVEFTVVSGTLEGSKKIAERLEGISNKQIKTIGGGFTKFLASPSCEDFFGQNIF